MAHPPVTQNLLERPRAFSFNDFSGEYGCYFSSGIGTGQRTLLAFVAFAVVIVAVLWSLMLVARARGVREVALPKPSLVARFEIGADYADAYELRLKPNAVKNMSQVIDLAFAKFTEIGRTDTEVLYTDRAPGLTFYVLYRLDAASHPTTLTMATVVHYTSVKGRLYFMLVRPFHRALVPLAFSRMHE